MLHSKGPFKEGWHHWMSRKQSFTKCGAWVGPWGAGFDLNQQVSSLCSLTYTRTHTPTTLLPDPQSGKQERAFREARPISWRPQEKCLAAAAAVASLVCLFTQRIHQHLGYPDSIGLSHECSSLTPGEDVMIPSTWKHLSPMYNQELATSHFEGSGITTKAQPEAVKHH